jgi:hypothetical protein
MPTEKEGSGLKNIHHSAKSLEAKSVWRLITGNGLWCRVVTYKYIKLAQ